MSEELDTKLRRALRAIDPGADFTARVMAQLSTSPSGVRRRLWRRAWVPATLAASIALVIIGAHEWQQHQEETGIAASRQVREALRVTSEKLDLAYRLVNTPPSAPPDPGGGSGA